MDNSQFTEEQRAEAYRVESMQQLVRQTKAVETIRTIVVIWAVLTALGLAFLLMSAVTRSPY